ncbi:hypothetical protein HPP92_028516 [Vanilla planifolia]|uniref:Uncharacterized protein n=1 Tax=Vanilla planifolia TaxID=51239 RepID=A0A835U430_VANPL|nr:hypothetical protein HPP92_028516 [Vanilla planifolia]
MEAVIGPLGGEWIRLKTKAEQKRRATEAGRFQDTVFVYLASLSTTEQRLIENFKSWVLSSMDFTCPSGGDGAFGF